MQRGGQPTLRHLEDILHEYKHRQNEITQEKRMIHDIFRIGFYAVMAENDLTLQRFVRSLPDFEKLPDQVCSYHLSIISFSCSCSSPPPAPQPYPQARQYSLTTGLLRVSLARLLSR